MKQKSLFDQIRRVVMQVPKGKVATYSQVAKLAGIKNARIVGWTLWGDFLLRGDPAGGGEE